MRFYYLKVYFLLQDKDAHTSRCRGKHTSQAIKLLPSAQHLSRLSPWLEAACCLLSDCSIANFNLKDDQKDPEHWSAASKPILMTMVLLLVCRSYPTLVWALKK